jgi:ubiquinone/menaquinone biosynthesis C-methylase UbiE
MNKRAKSIFERVAPVYDYLEYLPEELAFSKWRKLLWNMVEGDKALELGIGTGKNVPYYPPEKTLHACDISWNMVSIARKKSYIDLSRVYLSIMDIEDLAYTDNSFDTVVGSFIICSVDDALKSFKEIQRVCKPNGRILLLENVRSKNKLIGQIMDVVNFFTSRIKGANITRPTIDNIKKSSIVVEKFIPLFLDISWIIVCKNVK